MFGKKKVIIETYKGSQAKARELFLKDAKKKAKKGYVPASESWEQGSYGLGEFLVALLLCIVVIGILIFIYMLLVKPPGTLTVTFEYKGVKAIADSKEKDCPMCAEKIKVAALVCRFCGHKFEGEAQ